MAPAQRRASRNRDGGFGCSCFRWLAELCSGTDAFNKVARRRKCLRTVEDKEEYDFLMQQAVTNELVRILREEGHLPRPRAVTTSAIFGLARDSAGDDRPPASVRRRGSSENVVGVRRQQREKAVNHAVKLSWPITFQMAERLREHLAKSGGGSKPISEAFVVQMLNRFCSQYREQHPDPVAKVPMPSKGKLVLVGDTHGQLADVLLIFQVHGPPSRDNVYVFNGDIADRGSHACEIFLLVMAYFFADPASVVINRGNHEEPTLNRQSAYEGGGFFDEVKYKFGSPIYACFLEVFKVLNLCAVVGGKVFVVHGGLSSQENVTLKMIDEVDHSSRPLPDAAGGELTELEQLWVDLVWSDPCDEKGCYESARGAGCLFGPDKTREFLHANPGIVLVVRSHDLPEDNRGFCKHHFNRCLTLFSASNYCGDSGNEAAVMVFKSEEFPHYEVREHYAPDLDTIGELTVNDEPAHRWLEMGQDAFDEFNRGTKRDEAAWTKEIQKVMVAIVECKPDIWAKFMEVTGGLSLVTFQQWATILSSILVSEWDWRRLWDHWSLGGADGHVTNFVDFLRRFTVTLTRDEYLSFTLSAISEVYHVLLNQDINMQETLAQFDKDGDGLVEVAEMLAALHALDTSLSKAQLDVLVHAVFRGDRESIPVRQFFSRLSLVFRHAEMSIAPSAASQDERLLDEALQNIAQVVAITPTSSLCSQLGMSMLRRRSTCARRVPPAHHAPMQLGRARSSGSQGSRSRTTDGTTSPTADALADALAEKFTVVFAALDTDESGDIDNDEFVRGLWNVSAIREIELSNGEKLSEEILRKLASRLDHSRNGSISMWEFLSGFEVESSDADASSALVENIISLLLRHRNSIRAGLAHFDTTGSGVVRKADFEKVLRALNEAIAKTGHHWSPSQISDLCDALILEEEDELGNEDGADSRGSRIEYQSVFDSLQVVDSDCPEMGVRLGRIHKMQAAP